jgi:hypothetical protein
MSSVFGDHRRDAHNTHYEEDGKKNNCNDKYRHFAPPGDCALPVNRATVTAVTGRCEEGSKGERETAGQQIAGQSPFKFGRTLIQSGNL